MYIILFVTPAKTKEGITIFRHQDSINTLPAFVIIMYYFDKMLYFIKNMLLICECS